MMPANHFFQNLRFALASVAAAALLVCFLVSTALAEDKLVNVEINKGAMLKLARPASSVVVADPTTADVQVVSPKLLFIHGKRIGQTSLYAIDADENPIMNATVNVTHNISDLERTVKRVAPEADVTFKTVDGGLVMDGFTNSVAESESIRNLAAAYVSDKEKMVNMIKTGGSDQVMLKVKIVEMSRNDLKKLGVNLTSVVTRGGMDLQLLQGSDISFDSSNVLKRGAENTNTALLGKLTRGGFSLTNMVEALETQGLANVLAEPSLTTTSGKAASFLAGGQFPLPVKDQNGAVTIDYKPFGVSLNFTPVVMSKERMSITVAPEVSTLNFDNPIQVAGITYPILMTRKAEAVVELGSGDSFVLAGLLKNETSNNVNKFPGLGDVPVLGSLFRSNQFQNNETELVILVTPYLVRPVADRKLQTPIDGYHPPSDLERLLYGDLYKQQPMTDEEKKSMPQLNGGGGFILE